MAVIPLPEFKGVGTKTIESMRRSDKLASETAILDAELDEFLQTSKDRIQAKKAEYAKATQEATEFTSELSKGVRELSLESKKLEEEVKTSNPTLYQNMIKSGFKREMDENLRASSDVDLENHLSFIAGRDTPESYGQGYSQAVEAGADMTDYPTPDEVVENPELLDEMKMITSGAYKTVEFRQRQDLQTREQDFKREIYEEEWAIKREKMENDRLIAGLRLRNKVANDMKVNFSDVNYMTNEESIKKLGADFSVALGLDMNDEDDVAVAGALANSARAKAAIQANKDINTWNMDPVNGTPPKIWDEYLNDAFQVEMIYLKGQIENVDVEDVGSTQILTPETYEKEKVRAMEAAPELNGAPEDIIQASIFRATEADPRRIKGYMPLEARKVVEKTGVAPTLNPEESKPRRRTRSNR